MIFHQINKTEGQTNIKIRKLSQIRELKKIQKISVKMFRRKQGEK